MIEMFRPPMNDIFAYKGSTDIFLKGRLIPIPNGTKFRAFRKLLVGISPNVIVHSVLEAGDIGVRHS